MCVCVGGWVFGWGGWGWGRPAGTHVADEGSAAPQLG